MTAIVPFGHWDSPLGPEQVAAGKVSLSELASDGGALYWLESRPLEGGRVVLVRAAEDRLTDHSPEGVSIRSRVHEYGGGAVTLIPGHGAGAFAYVDQSDQRVWLCTGGPAAEAGVPRALSTEPDAGGSTWHHGGLSASSDGDWVMAVRENHPADGGPPGRHVVALGTRPDNHGCSVVMAGHDFFGTPRLHPSGDRVVAMVWDHPDMPWDASLVEVAPVAVRTDATGHRQLQPDGSSWVIAGGATESVGQPMWGRNGALRFVSDRTGWWQIFRHPGDATGGTPVALTDRPAEFHGPDWVLSQMTMAELPGGALVARMTAHGRDTLVRLDPSVPASSVDPPVMLDQPCVSISGVCAHGEGIAFIGSTTGAPPNVWVQAVSSAGAGPAGALRPISSVGLEPEDVAIAEPFSLTGRSGRPVYGSLYRPARKGTAGPSGQRPPLVVWCHGGPTAAAGAGFDLALQFFTTRGFAVACVDYAGSTGYGRPHRMALWGQWGVADAEDCRQAARYLADRGDVDPNRLAIRGGSAGGLTALNALVGESEFAACASWYGVTDLLALVATTHDFEARYTDRLIGPLPEAHDLYEARSPVNHAAAMTGAVLLLQGADDAVVPAAQSIRLHDALVAAGRPCELRMYEGEGHGFRRADTLIDCLQAELAFYQRELGL